MRSTFLLTAFLLAGTQAFAAPAIIQGTITDPSSAAIAGAEVSAAGRVGVLATTKSDGAGRFELKLPDAADARIVVTAPGFATATVEPGKAHKITLSIAPLVDAVKVAGSILDIPLNQQGGSVSLITAEEVQQRNEATASDLLRYVPGVALAQNGGRGGASSMFLRGGSSNYTLVMIDGVPTNSFGGGFDFAHIPAFGVDRVEVARGPQSAIYGPYANSGAINFVTRAPGESPTFDVLLEGGSHGERRFGIGGAAKVLGFGITASAQRMDNDGIVPNGDYKNQSLSLKLDRTFGRQALSASGFLINNDRGDPGPYGSNPLGIYKGIDRITRDKNDFSSYTAHYRIDFNDRVRQEFFGDFFLYNNGYASPYGFSYNKDMREQGESRTVVSVSSHYTTAFGVTIANEQVKNTYITDAAFASFPIDRKEEGFYWENRFQVKQRLFFNAGARAEIIQTAKLPGDGYARPEFAAKTFTRVNPKLSAAYLARQETRLHASFGMGFRPPAGFELAYTDNPALKPERTTSFDAGVEQRLLGNKLSVDATYFYNRFTDLIVSLGGSLSSLGHYKTDNISNARAQGVELSARLRPARWMRVEGWYTWLGSQVLALNGSNGLAPAYFQVGQDLVRRPAHTGAIVSTFTWQRWSANVTGSFRGSVLDVEPNYGASSGLYKNGGYANVGVNLNYHLGRGCTLYGSLRNALNQRYEEAFGYPSPLLNFVAGMKWRIGKGQ